MRLRIIAEEAIGSDVIEISPQSFINLAMPFGHQGGPEADETKINKFSKIETPNPTLSIKETKSGSGVYQVGLHDGRHRALAAIKNNQRTIPVNITLGKRFARENPDISIGRLVSVLKERGFLLNELGDREI